MDINIKGQMICDLLNLVGFVLLNTEDIISSSNSSTTRSASLLFCSSAGSVNSPIVTLGMNGVWVLPPAWSPLPLICPYNLFMHYCHVSAPKSMFVYIAPLLGNPHRAWRISFQLYTWTFESQLPLPKHPSL